MGCRRFNAQGFNQPVLLVDEPQDHADLKSLLRAILADTGHALRQHPQAVAELHLRFTHPYAIYEPAPLLERLEHSAEGLAQFQKKYERPPDCFAELQRLQDIQRFLVTAFQEAYQATWRQFQIEQFLSEPAWSRTFALTLAQVYRISETSKPEICRGVMNSPAFWHDKLHIQGVVLRSGFEAQYKRYIEAYGKDLQACFAQGTGHASPQALMNAIIQVEDKLRKDAHALVRSLSVHHQVPRQSPGEVYHERKLLYYDTVELILQNYENESFLSADQLNQLYEEDKITLIDLQAHTTYQLGEHELLRKAFMAKWELYLKEPQGFQEFTWELRADMQILSKQRRKMLDAVVAMNALLDSMAPEAYLLKIQALEKPYIDYVSRDASFARQLAHIFPEPVYRQVTLKDLRREIAAFERYYQHAGKQKKQSVMQGMDEFWGHQDSTEKG